MIDGEHLLNIVKEANCYSVKNQIVKIAFNFSINLLLNIE
jgi:hypothetical protein